MFLYFPEFNDHYWPTKPSNLADGLLDITPEAKNIFEIFHYEIWELFKFAIFCNFLNISFLFDLSANKARKPKVAESNQAKASLVKPWLATDEAYCSPIV